MRALCLGESLHPIGDLVETFVACVFSHSRIHVCVLVGFTCDGRLEVFLCATHRHAGGRIAYFLEVLEVAMCVTSLAFSGRAEKR